MPYINGEYVATEWRNNVPPFINASAMSEMTEANSSGQTRTDDIRLCIDGATNTHIAKQNDLNGTVIESSSDYNSIFSRVQLVLQDEEVINMAEQIDNDNETIVSNISNRNNYFIWVGKTKNYSYYVSGDTFTQGTTSLFYDMLGFPLETSLSINNRGLGLASYGKSTIGADGTNISYTKNDGREWRDNRFEPSKAQFISNLGAIKSVHIDDNGNGFIFGTNGSYVIESYDLFEDWDATIKPMVHPFGSSFVFNLEAVSNVAINSKGYGAVFTLSGRVAFTKNFGKTWQSSTYSVSNAFPYSVKVLDDNTFIASCKNLSLSESKSLRFGYIDNSGAHFTETVTLNNEVGKPFASKTIGGYYELFSPPTTQTSPNIQAYKYLGALSSSKTELNIPSSISPCYVASVSLSDNGMFAVYEGNTVSPKIYRYKLKYPTIPYGSYCTKVKNPFNE